jgi:hypothetical protein
MRPLKLPGKNEGWVQDRRKPCIICSYPDVTSKHDRPSQICFPISLPSHTFFSFLSTHVDIGRFIPVLNLYPIFMIPLVLALFSFDPVYRSLTHSFVFGSVILWYPFTLTSLYRISQLRVNLIYRFCTIRLIDINQSTRWVHRQTLKSRSTNMYIYEHEKVYCILQVVRQARLILGIRDSRDKFKQESVPSSSNFRHTQGSHDRSWTCPSTTRVSWRCGALKVHDWPWL